MKNFFCKKKNLVEFFIRKNKNFLKIFQFFFPENFQNLLEKKHMGLSFRLFLKNFPRFLKSFQFHYKKIIWVRAALPFPPPPVSTSSFVLVSHLYAKVEGGRSVTRKRSGNLIGGPFADQASPCKILP